VLRANRPPPPVVSTNRHHLIRVPAVKGRSILRTRPNGCIPTLLPLASKTHVTSVITQTASHQPKNSRAANRCFFMSSGNHLMWDTSC